MPPVLILGCGYVGTRVALRLLGEAERVHATSRDVAALGLVASSGGVVHQLDTANARSLRELAACAAELGPGLRVLVSMPPPGSAIQARCVFDALGANPARLVLLSTTSVYGAQPEVNERTAPAPSDDASQLRLEAERLAARGPWTTLVLRCAAIYGPGRGVHVALREGRLGRVRDLDRVVSRVHVDDLSSLVVAALRSEVQGAWPGADDLPATTREVAAFCATLGLPALRGADSSCSGNPTGRRVNGRAVRSVLGVKFRYPSYREGIAAAILGERDSVRS